MMYLNRSDRIGLVVNNISYHKNGGGLNDIPNMSIVQKKEKGEI